MKDVVSCVLTNLTIPLICTDSNKIDFSIIQQAEQALFKSWSLVLSEPISLRFSYNRNEYVRAIRRHLKTVMRVRLDVFGAIFSIGMGFYLVNSCGINVLSMLPLTVGGLLLAIIGYAMFIVPHLWYTREPKLKQQYYLVFSNAGIEFQTAGIDSKLDWSIYRKWLSDKDFYILYYGKWSLTVVPRRAFLNPADDRAFHDLLINNIGNPMSERH
jgi:hypothetical protein